MKNNTHRFELFAYLAKHYYKNNDFAKVKEILEQTRERRKRDTAAMWFTAEKYYQIGEYQLAKEILKELFAQEKKFHKIPYMLAQIFIKENNLPEALIYINHTINLRPFDCKLQLEKLQLLATLNDPTIISELRNVTHINPVITKQTLADDTFANYHKKKKYQQIIALARERHNFLSKPVFLLETEFSNHPILKRMEYHLALAVAYHYLRLLGFSRITILYSGVDYIGTSCLKHCYPEYFQQNIMQEIPPRSANSLNKIPVLVYQEMG